ncbi:MAG: hypothetical protein ACRDQ5_06270 [Sciscionella sp.]
MRLYPRWWRERYGEEFAELVADLSGGHRRLWLLLDIGRGALDAHLHGRQRMTRSVADGALRRGTYDGAVIAGVLAVVVVLTNVVFPQGPTESDSDPEYRIPLLAGYVLLAVLLMAIGAHARRRSDTPLAGLKAGAAAGFVLAVLVTLTFLAVNNLFLDIVSQQHDKQVGFAASGWSSMRAYLTVTQLVGAAFLLPIATLIGAVLGFLGGGAFRPRTQPTTE